MIRGSVSEPCVYCVLKQLMLLPTSTRIITIIGPQMGFGFDSEAIRGLTMAVCRENWMSLSVKSSSG